MFRIGLGTDSHAFEKVAAGRKVVLGGVVIPHPLGLDGDSDADVVLHALFNAMTSAVGDRGIGFYFKKADMEKGYADSANMIRRALEIISDAGFELVNVSVALELKEPKIEPNVPAMKKRMADILGIIESAIGISATSGDGMSPYAKGEGIYGQVIVLLQEK